MDRSMRGRHMNPLLVASVLLVLVMLSAVGATGCGSSTGSSSSLTTMTTIAAESTVVTQASGANAQGPGATVKIHNGTVTPTDLQVPVGSAVTFQDTDDDTTRTYHLVSADGSFDTGVLGEGGSYIITFQQTGTIEYQDKNDPTIKGKIQVD
jgi:plastocyanin